MIKILIVDDEKPICDLIDLNLSAAGYFCKSVQDGMKAIECIEREKFDLILLDIMLPGVDGFDIMEYIRPLKIPVIFITARGDVKDRVKGLRLGAEDYLVKPFDVVELLARVEVVLRRFHKTGAQLSAGDVVVDMDGRMVTNSWYQNEEGKWYYFAENGKAVKNGWKTIDDAEYYFLKSGTMATDVNIPGGGHVGADGKRDR